MNRFDDLAAFVAVVETGSFTAAAERLGSDKSAVSRRISALEERLGVQLLRRTTRTLNLTDSGRGFHQRAARILSDLEEAESALARAHGALRGRLRLSLPLSFGVRHMCRPIAEFSHEHPAVTFDLDLTDRKVDLLQEGMDLALRIGRLEDSTLIARRLFDTRVLVVASKAYLDRRGMPQTPDDLQHHDCLTYSYLADARHWDWLDVDGTERRAAINVAMAANSGDLLCDAAVAGLGIAMQPTFIAHQYVCRGDLVPLLRNYRWPAASAYAIYPPTRHLSYRVRAFIDFLAAYFDGTPYWDKDCEDAERAVSQLR
jgi:DNA-binding transcriptional LysR family regulator